LGLIAEAMRNIGDRNEIGRSQLECPACGCRLWQVYLAGGVHQLECRGCGGDVGIGMIGMGRRVHGPAVSERVGD
jgi:hypothetical protein